MKVRRLLTPRWLLRHAAVLVLVVTFCALARWQFLRASAGNTLSWGYTLEWPLFAGFVIAMWVHAVREELRSTGAGGPRRSLPPISLPPSSTSGTGVGAGAQDSGTGTGTEVDDELSAYNRYLAWLKADPDRRASDYPG